MSGHETAIDPFEVASRVQSDVIRVVHKKAPHVSDAEIRAAEKALEAEPDTTVRERVRSIFRERLNIGRFLAELKHFPKKP